LADDRHSTPRRLARDPISLLPPAVALLLALAGACSPSSPVSAETDTANYHVQLDLDSASLGRRTATIEVTDSGGRPVDARRVVVSTAMPAMDLSGPTVVADELRPGRDEARGDLFTMLGETTLTVRIQAGGTGEEIATFAVEAES
jgi:hypothetical protein